MGLLSKLFGREKVTNVVVPLAAERGLYTFGQTVQVKWRPTTLLDDALRAELVEVCRGEACVRRAYFLDVLEEATGQTKLFISLSLDDAEAHQVRVGTRLHEVLQRRGFGHPWFIGADAIGGLHEDAAGYVRGG